MAATALGLRLGRYVCSAAHGVSRDFAASHLRAPQHDQEYSRRTDDRPDGTHRPCACRSSAFQVFEAFTVATILYLITNLIVTYLMRKLEAPCRCRVTWARRQVPAVTEGSALQQFRLRRHLAILGYLFREA